MHTIWETVTWAGGLYAYAKMYEADRVCLS